MGTSNLNSGRLPRPIEQSQALVKGDGRLPGGRRISPKGTVVVNPDHSSLPEPPAAGDDGRPLHESARELHAKIWKAGYWLHPDKDFWWIDQVALMTHEIAWNNVIVQAEGEMIKGDRGNLVEHPLRAANRQLRKMIATYMQRAGYDPVSRSKLQIAEVQVATGLQALQAKTASRNGAG
jgi:hypothetical protein